MGSPSITRPLSPSYDMWHAMQSANGQASGRCSPAASRINEVKSGGEALTQLVQSCLASGGAIRPLYTNVEWMSTGGVYGVFNAEERCIAVFKPDDERYHGPCNPNPNRRESYATEDEERFKQLHTFFLSQPSRRHHSAKLLDFANLMPAGTITSLTSDQFVDLAAEACCRPKRRQCKEGYLQAWVDNARTLKSYDSDKSEDYSRYWFTPVLDQVPLHEFQQLLVLGILLFNQDLHPGNILIKDPESQNPHIAAFDFKCTLPWKLDSLDRGPYWLRQARTPLTPEVRELINNLDVNAVGELVKSAGMHEEIIKNAQVLCLVLKSFADHDKTLFDTFLFLSKEGQDANPLTPLLKQAEQEALDLLPPEDWMKWNLEYNLRWRSVFSKEVGRSGQLSDKEQNWLSDYDAHDAARINAELRSNILRRLKEILDNHLGSQNLP